MKSRQNLKVLAPRNQSISCHVYGPSCQGVNVKFAPSRAANMCGCVFYPSDIFSTLNSSGDVTLQLSFCMTCNHCGALPLPFFPRRAAKIPFFPHKTNLVTKVVCKICTTTNIFKHSNSSHMFLFRRYFHRTNYKM